jgi:hypothetical protein
MDPSAQSSVTEYLDYLLNVYAELAALDATIPAAELEDLSLQWRSAPKNLEVPEPPRWLQYFRDARAVIDGFFPTLAPLPMHVVQE